MFIEKRLLEIKEALGPILKTLGLESGVQRVGAALHVIFEIPGEERWRSPVEISFRAEEFSKHEEASWEECEVICKETVVKFVGATGWKCHEILDWETWTPESGKHAIELVSDMIEHAALYPVGVNVPQVPNFYDFRSFWYYLVKELDRVFGIVETDLELHRSDDGDDIVSFEYGGGNFEIVFLVYPYDALLRLDGEVKTRSVDRSSEDVIDMVTSYMLREIDPKF